MPGQPCRKKPHFAGPHHTAHVNSRWFLTSSTMLDSFPVLEKRGSGLQTPALFLSGRGPPWFRTSPGARKQRFEMLQFVFLPGPSLQCWCHSFSSSLLLLTLGFASSPSLRGTAERKQGPRERICYAFLCICGCLSSSWCVLQFLHLESRELPELMAFVLHKEPLESGAGQGACDGTECFVCVYKHNLNFPLIRINSVYKKRPFQLNHWCATLGDWCFFSPSLNF